MAQENSPFKIVAVAIILATGGSGYFLSESTLLEKATNAKQNATQPWAADALANVAWRFDVTLREDKAISVYEDWLMIYGGDVVAEALFPDRWDEVQYYGYDEDYQFDPPRARDETPHPMTADILLTWATYKETKHDNEGAGAAIRLILDELPECSEKVAKAAANFEKRLSAKTFK